jgi:hypothetical protein
VFGAEARVVGIVTPLAEAVEDIRLDGGIELQAPPSR